MCHKKVIRNIHKSYIGKIKIYLNDTKPKILFQTELRPWQTSNANLAVYTELDLNILLFRVKIKSHMIHFQIEKVTEMKEFHIKQTYIFFYNMKEMSKFCKSVKL